MADGAPQIVRSKAEMIEISSVLRASGETIGLVPTMGYLHPGHLSLVKLSKENASKTVVYIFVNPKQFNVGADLESYPRDEERDIALLSELSVDYVFIPDGSAIYPDGYESSGVLSKLTEGFEGAGRPGHFEGVTTVLSIFFHIVNPHFAVFGEKDFQQLRVVEKMVSDLAFPMDILRGPLVRESDGLAMSSRNVLLNPQQRKVATVISKALFSASREILESDVKAVKKNALAELDKEQIISSEYFEVADEKTLEPVERKSVDKGVVICVAARIGDVRLIDNVIIS